MFYESHQAEWVDGRMTKAELLQEPQGKLPPTHPARGPLATDNTAAQEPQSKVLPGQAGTVSRPPVESTPAADLSNLRINTAAQPAQVTQLTQLVATEAMPLVQQQLEALATQNFSWHGQVWPGQEMRWEIEEDAARREQGSDEASGNWQTRLRLSLPNLGEVEARIRLQGNQISLILAADNSGTQELLRTSTEALRSQLDEAGLALASVGVEADHS